jgi:CBS domain-containing protein
VKCFDVMKKGTALCWTTDLVQLVAERMRVNHTDVLPVLDDGGRVVGTLSSRDLVMGVLAERRRPEYTTAGDVMSIAFTVRATDDVEIARRLMGVHHLDAMICVDPTGRPVGRILASDLPRKSLSLRPPPGRVANDEGPPSRRAA